MNKTNYYIIFAFVALMLVSVVCFGVFFALVWQPLLFAYIAAISGTGAYILTHYDVRTHK